MANAIGIIFLMQKVFLPQSFNGKLRDECLNGEIFYSLEEAQIIIEQWRIHYNTQRPHSALAYRPPVPVTRAIKPTQPIK